MPSEADLYLVPGAGMSSASYRFLATALAKKGIRLKLFEVRGLDGRSPPHASTEEIVEDYLAGLRLDRPSGPYALAGHSFGGSVAFEMARKLEIEGHEVSVQMLDSLLTSPQRYHFDEMRDRLADQRLDGGAGLEMRGDARPAAQIKTRRTSENIHETLVTQAMLADSFEPSGVFGGHVTLFLAEEGSICKSLLPRVLEEYRRWHGAEPVYHEVPGGHLSMLHQEHAHALAAALAASLLGTAN